MAAISAENISEQISKCGEYLFSSDWNKYDGLFKSIYKYLNEDGKETVDNKEFIKLQNNATQILKKTLEATSDFDEFQLFLSHLDITLQDKRKLWDLLHGMNTILKVTLHQSQLIAVAYFSPVDLFEFGFETFMDSHLAEFGNSTNEEAIIDIFYAAAGFVRACNLEKTFESTLPKYQSFIEKMLREFTKIADFDAHRFVWLVQVIHENLHLASACLLKICEEIFSDYINNNVEKINLVKLHKLCIVSTSPFLKKLPKLHEWINQVYIETITEQRLFVRKYIFVNFACYDWAAPMIPSLSLPLKCWRLYLTHLASRIHEKTELPNMLLIDFLDDSLCLFEGYYAGVQPTKEKAVNLRMDIFAIIELITQFYTNEMSAETLKRIWYLLYIVAVSGAREEELQNVKPRACDEPNMPFLGLERNGTDFVSYKIALDVLSHKFLSEFNSFPRMCEFIRCNYNKPPPPPPAAEPAPQ